MSAGPLVFLLWSHGEYGPENLLATLNPADLPALFMSYDDGWFARIWDDPEQGPKISEDIKRFAEEGKVGIYSLTRGWGGLHFQIVQTNAPNPFAEVEHFYPYLEDWKKQP